MDSSLKTKTQITVGYLLALIVFFLPLKVQVSTIFIILSLVASLLIADWKNFRKDITQNKFFLISIAYFTVHLAGILYSDNIKYAFNDVQSKLSFLIFPFLYIAAKPTPQQINFIKRSFIAGCITALIICFVKAAIEFQTYHDTDVFFYSKFSRMMHTTYFSFYLNVALIFLIDGAYKNVLINKFRFQVEFFFTELFLLTGIFLLSARMSLLATAFTLIVFVIMKTIQFKSNWKFTIAIFISFLLAGGIQYELNSFYNRFAQIENTIVNEKQITNDIAENQTKPAEINSTTSRIALWKYSLELITSSPQNILIGVGTGDIKDELMKVFVKNKFQKGIDEHYNPHNQYLHTSVSLGITGFILLLAMLFYPMIVCISERNFLTAVFLAIIVLNALTESILEVQSGIIFFGFFYGLLLNKHCNYRQT